MSTAVLNDRPKVPGKRLEEPMECVVCKRPFKNPNALDKHLRFVHTVTTDNGRQVYKKHAAEARLKHSLTNNTAPVKPAIAKALASKLSQKKKISDENAATAAAAASSADTPKDNTIIIYEVTQLTEDNMYDTNQLLNGGGNGGTTCEPMVAEYASMPQASIVCNGTTETNMIVPHPGTSEILVDVPKMIVLKKSKKGEPSAYRAQSGDILNLDNGAIVRKEEPYGCEECKKTFAKKYQLKRHQETHDSIFYICPYCDKAPLKTRTSMKKHFTHDHNDKSHEWNTSNFLSKQILRDEAKLRELRKKYPEKKRLNGEKLVEAINRAMHADDATSTSDSLDSLVEDMDNNNVHNGFNGSGEIAKRPSAALMALKNAKALKQIKGLTAMKKLQHKNSRPKLPPNEYMVNSQQLVAAYHHHHHQKPHDDHEIENLFDNLINDNLLDPLNGNEYEGDDDQMQTNFIQETFQNSFKEIQEKLDADLECGSEQIKWEDNLKSDDSSDEIMSDKLLDESADLMLI